MNYTLYRKQAQIGGNIIEISTPTTRILLDIGLELDNQQSIPDIPGLFNAEGIDAVIVTHYHSDHMGLAYHIHNGIPLYMGEMCTKITQASDMYKGIPTLTPSGYLKHNQSYKIKDIKITPFLCDHSAFDSYMILCETDQTSILYTGDFRAHGRKPKAWLFDDLPKQVDTLICEGTTLSRAHYQAKTEAQLEEECVSLFKETP